MFPSLCALAWYLSTRTRASCSLASMTTSVRRLTPNDRCKLWVDEKRGLVEGTVSYADQGSHYIVETKHGRFAVSIGHPDLRNA